MPIFFALFWAENTGSSLKPNQHAELSLSKSIKQSDSLENSHTAENSGRCSDRDLKDGHWAEDGVLKVGVGAGRGVTPVLGPPDGQQEEVDGVGGHAIVVSDCQIVRYVLDTNDVTQFWTIFDTPTSHRQAF